MDPNAAAQNLVRRIRKVQALHADQPLPATATTLARLLRRAEANPIARALLREERLPSPPLAPLWVPLLVWACARLRVDPSTWTLVDGTPDTRDLAREAVNRADSWLHTLPASLQTVGALWLLDLLRHYVRRAPPGIRPRKSRRSYNPTAEELAQLQDLERHIGAQGGPWTVFFAILDGPEEDTFEGLLGEDDDIWEGTSEQRFLGADTP